MHLCDIIPGSVTGIADHAFTDSTLTGVTFGSGVTNLGSSAFTYSHLTSVALPSGLTGITEYAFSDCKSLTNVTIPAGIRSFQAETFAGCLGLRGVYFRGNAPSVDPSAFQYDTATAYYLRQPVGLARPWAACPPPGRRRA